MKKHNILKVVLIALLTVVVLTWIFPTATFSTTLTVGERAQMGIFDIFNYFGQSFQYFYQILVYALIVGGFYGVLSKTEAYRKLLDKIVDAFKGREWLFISIVTICLLSKTASENACVRRVNAISGYLPSVS